MNVARRIRRRTPLMVGGNWLIRRFQRATGAVVTHHVIRLEAELRCHYQRSRIGHIGW